MIHILNRKEVCITYSMQRQTEARAILEQHRIPYTVKVHSGAMRNVGVPAAMLDLVGQKLENAIEYRFFVHKNDYERAKHVLG